MAITLAPLADNCLAVVRPIPEVPPKTNAVLPKMSMIVQLFYFENYLW